MIMFSECKSTNAQKFAEFVRKKWKMGNCGNDVLILLAADQDQVC